MQLPQLLSTWLRAANGAFKSRLLPSTFNNGVAHEILPAQYILRPGTAEKMVSPNINRLYEHNYRALSRLARRAAERENDGSGFDNRQMAERMAEINVEKVSGIKTVMSLNHRLEIILKARVNILPPVARRIRSPRDEDFEQRASIPASIVPAGYR